MKKLIYVTVVSLLMLSSLSFAKNDEKLTDVAASHNIPYGEIIPDLIPFGYSGGEKFRYDISYTSGIKLGELYIELIKDEGLEDVFTIRSRATTTNGFFEKIYPVEDLHVTKVSGPERLPFHYEVWQKEGFSYEAHRITRYDQDNRKIYYQHNEYPVKTYTVSNTTQNEFSSFFASRLMRFVPGESFVVPTFADKKRVEVVVMVKDREVLEETIFGMVNTIQIEPIMTFRGLYDKRGDTVVWYTDDKCRVPVLINSKLMVGSLTATLVGYENDACPQYDGALLEEYRSEKGK